MDVFVFRVDGLLESEDDFLMLSFEDNELSLEDGVRSSNTTSVESFEEERDSELELDCDDESLVLVEDDSLENTVEDSEIFLVETVSLLSPVRDVIDDSN